MAQAHEMDHGPHDKFSLIADALYEKGYSVYNDFASPILTHALATEARRLHQEGAFHHARIGHGRSLQLRPDIRNDHVLWLDPETPSAIHLSYFAELEQLRQAINRHLFMGLFDFEGHYAIYPPGSYYKMHYDRFVGTTQRVVTCILYLNDDWQAENGGILKIYPGGTINSLHEPLEVLPIAGCLVTFISGDFPHEVLAANQERISLTGWFLLR